MFKAGSRYYNLDTAVYEDADGRQITYVKRRFLPRGDELQLLVEVTVAEGDRLDLIANRALGSSEASWWICDANDAMHPAELLDEPGRELRVPVPQDLIAMSLLGVHLTTMIGPTVPLPLAADLANMIEQVQVTHDDSQASGFQITFRVGKTQTSVSGADLALKTLLTGNARVVLIVTVGAIPQVLMDGYVTRKEFNPGAQPGESTLTITGVDATFKMDREEKTVEHPAQPDAVIATKIIASYGLIPMVIPPVSMDVPLPIERVPVQQGTDLAYLRELAAQYGYVFYVVPGPAPLMNTGYWGPPIRVGVPQSALSMNMGAYTNLDRFDVSLNMDTATLVEGQVLDRQTGQTLPVITAASTRVPLGREPALSLDPTSMRKRTLREPGLNAVQAYARAQAMTDASTDAALVANGTLDSARYGAVLQPRALVGVRGLLDDYNGNWYVQRVTHSLRRGSYKQDFVLQRGEIGSLLPLVLP